MPLMMGGGDGDDKKNDDNMYMIYSYDRANLQMMIIVVANDSHWGGF